MKSQWKHAGFMQSKDKVWKPEDVKFHPSWEYNQSPGRAAYMSVIPSEQNQNMHKYIDKGNSTINLSDKWMTQHAKNRHEDTGVLRSPWVYLSSVVAYALTLILDIQNTSL